MNTESMRDVMGNEVRVGDKVVFVTTGYSHRVNLRVGIVSKIRYDYYKGISVASVKYEGVSYGGIKRTITSGMRLPRLVKIS